MGIAESELPTLKVVHIIFQAKLESGKVQISEEHADYVWIKPEEFKTLDLVEWFNQFVESYRIS